MRRSRTRPDRVFTTRHRLFTLSRLGAAIALAAVLVAAPTAPAPAAEARDAGQSIATSPTGVVPAITAGNAHTCALLNTGQITCWGFGANGRLGNGTTTDQTTPTPPITLPPDTTATAITAGNAHTCALLNTGQITCWGLGSSGQLGNGTTTNQTTPTPPITLPPDTTATAITAGNAHTCALLNTGQITCWGLGSSGQLGNGTTTNQTTPTPPITLPPDTTATAIDAGTAHTCALLNTGQITCWGLGTNGQLGNGTTTNSQTTPTPPITLPTGTTATAITAGNAHTCALLNTGQITCWGFGSSGQLGNGTTTNSQTTPTPPITLPPGTTATAITAGNNHTCALLNTGQITCWGRQNEGQLGNGSSDIASITTPPAPITLPPGTTATAITTDTNHTCALLNTSQITCWGRGAFGRLGNGTTTEQATPTPTSALPTVDLARRTTAITAGGFHTCALLNTGQITCWGSGGFGWLGNGTTTDQTTPTPPITLPPGTTATAITAGTNHTCALLNTGQITCWGLGSSGQLGNGTTTNQTTPTPPITLPPGTTATAITAGTNHTCALLNTSQITCWGRGANGQLGNGTTTDQTTPTPPITLPPGTTATAITAGTAHTCALLNTGQITCWGFGTNGQLGNGTTTNSQTTPTPPITLPTGTTATAITAGNAHTCALLNTGQITCWGFGSSGQLGNGTTTNSQTTPTPHITLPPGTTATAITAGNNHTCALLNTGQITCWGRQNEGQLGNGSSDIASITTPPAPITLPPGTTATAITTDTNHTCALLNTSQITCWGSGGNGQLGNGTTTEQPTPTLVTFATAPTLTLATGQTTPTNNATIDITATFNQPITTLDAADITIGGTANATTATPTGTDTTWNIAITGMTNDGTVTVTIPPGPLGTFGNLGSNTITIDYDATGPTATITQATGQPDPAAATPISFTVTFDEPVTGFDTNDIALTGTAGATITDTEITGSGTDYTVTINQVANPGTIIVTTNPGAVTDTLGNPSTTVIVDNTITINDITPPVIYVPDDITVDTEPDAPTATVTYTVTATDPDSTGTATNNDAAARFAGTVTIDCTPPSGSQFPIGTTTVDCTATDTSGNTTTADFTITVNAITTITTTTTTTTTTAPPVAPTTTPVTTTPPPPINPDIILPATGNSSRTLTTTLLIALLLTLGGTATVHTTRRR